MLGLHTAITTTFAVHHQLLPDDRLPTQNSTRTNKKKRVEELFANGIVLKSSVNLHVHTAKDPFACKT
jgi:hypothetical protein